MRRSWAFAALATALCAGCSVPAEDARAGAGEQAPPACVPGQQLCPSGCVELTSNPQHCGACGMACAPGAVCEAGACRDVCGAGLGLCGGQCVSLQTSAHCGSCENACQAGLVCVGGACSASCAGTICTSAAGAECVTLTDDRNHCGTCNHACAPSDKCEAGLCVLDCGALTACDGACVDVLSDAAHCGSCTTPCAVDEACMQGACVCAPGKTACGESCVDTAIDPAHCGGCDQACGTDGLCEAGKCLGPDGCTDTPVTGLTLSAIDVYQSVQIPIMEEGTVVASGARNADVVARRKALFRVHVTPEAGWTPREVSARIELTRAQAPMPDQSELFFAPLTPTRASSDDDESSTFQLLVPAESIAADTRYAVTLVECAASTTAPAPAAAGTPGAGARFPSTGYEPLEARETGPLKVHVVPLGIPGPDVSEQVLEVFEQRLLAVYPVTEVSFTVGEPLQSSATSMCSVLGSISSRRSQDSPAPDVYYYGLTPGILGGQSGCSNASASPSGSKVAAGWAQGFSNDDAEGAATMCHELGHSHGRMHAPCNVQDPDRSYPYPDAEIGVWGYDFRSNALLEPTRKDMMSYCPEPRWNAWISDYNYQAILERVVAVSALAEVPAVAALRRGPSVVWRMLVSDSAGVHWVEEPLLVQGTPEGTPVNAVVHGESGPMQQVTVYHQALEDGVRDGAFMLTLPEPDPSWLAIEVPGLLAPQALAFDAP